MQLVLQRLQHGKESTYGALFCEDKQLCFTIEDQPQEVKVANETRIPRGFYEVKYREVLSPMTEKYRNKFDFFTWHLELQNVPNFKYVYIHIGNKESHSSGCLLVNKGVTEVDGEYVGSHSGKAFEEIYRAISEKLDSGEKVWLTVEDEDKIRLPF